MVVFKKGYYADVRIENRFNTLISFVDGKSKEIKERREKRAFVRVFDGKNWYYGSTTQLDEAQEVLNSLYEKARKKDGIERSRLVSRFQ